MRSVETFIFIIIHGTLACEKKPYATCCDIRDAVALDTIYMSWNWFSFSAGPLEIQSLMTCCGNFEFASLKRTKVKIIN